MIIDADTSLEMDGVIHLDDGSGDDLSATDPPSYDDSCQWLPPPTLRSNSSSSRSTPNGSSSSINSSRSRPVPNTPGSRSERPSPNRTGRSQTSRSPNRLQNINGEVYLLPPPQQLGPVVYQFAQHSYNSMLLSARDDATPLYHISVHMNCFVPTSYITTICRGGSPDGEPIGSFEMGISTAKSTVTMNGAQRRTEAVLTKAGSKSRRVFQWQWHTDKQRHLSWHCDSPVKYCYLSTQVGSPNASLLASFTPQALSPRADGAPSAPAALKLFPDGASFADHIVLSALVLERQRLSPSSGAPLFN